MLLELVLLPGGIAHRGGPTGSTSMSALRNGRDMAVSPFCLVVSANFPTGIIGDLEAFDPGGSRHVVLGRRPADSLVPFLCPLYPEIGGQAPTGPDPN
jgi:hypothetical protein